MASPEQLESRSKIKPFPADSGAFQHRIINVKPIDRIDKHSDDSLGEPGEQHHRPVPAVNMIRDPPKPDPPHRRMKRPADQMKESSNFAASRDLNQKIPQPLHGGLLVGRQRLRRPPVDRERPVHAVGGHSCLQNRPPQRRVLRCHVRHPDLHLRHNPRVENHR